jgi:hypothetical protein
MIPREILKKIRQIELRTNRIVTETLAGTSLQPPQQLRRISRTVKNGDHIDAIWFNRIINAVFAKSFKSDLMSQTRDEAKSFGGFQNLQQCCIDVNSEFLSQSSTLIFIPSCRIFKLKAGKRREDDRACHALRDFKRSWSSTCTISHGIPRSGCCRNSSVRRSSSAICSDVSSSSKRSRNCSKTSRCSATGSFSICSNTWAALIAEIYSFQLVVQAGFSASRFTFHTLLHA